MLRYLAGVGSALLLVAAGVFLFRGSASSPPPQPVLPRAVAGVGAAPQPGATDAELPPLPRVPEAPDRTREQRRFDRYDKDRDNRITLAEYMEPRRKAFARLDRDRNGQLSFEEWAARGITKFGAADRDRSQSLDRAEFLTTRVQRRTPRRPRCDCGPGRGGAAAVPAEADAGDN